ncbi:MAG: hypothetical protein Q9213_001927 [Squamulea squamosa]
MLPTTETYGYGIDVRHLSCDLVVKENLTPLQSAFQINLRGAAHLTFAQAKLIDLIFNLVVGQGGRLLLTAISYLVFMDALLRFMEITPVSFKLYASLAFSSMSLDATWQATKAVFATKGWRARMYLTWCAVAMIYTLAFPTLIDSATGYISPSSVVFNINKGPTFTRLDSDELTRCYNVTNNATLLGFPQDTAVVIGPEISVYDAFKYQGLTFTQIPMGVNQSTNFWHIHTDDLYLIWHINGTNFTTTELQAQNRYPDVSYYNYTTSIFVNGRMRYLDNIEPSSEPDPMWKLSYCYGEQAMDRDALFADPGFSSTLLYVILSLQLAWTVGMYYVWLDANLASKLVQSGRTLQGPFRAAADLVEAVNEKLGHKYCAYTDAEIQKELEKSGTVLRYSSTFRKDSELLHIGLTTRPGPRVSLARGKLYGAQGNMEE